MPYQAFIDDLKWKSEFETDKAKRIEEERKRNLTDRRAKYLNNRNLRRG